MISCDRAKELLSAFLEGELSPDLKLAMESHLQVCQNCQQLGADVTFISQKMHVIKPINTSEQFDQQLRSRIINDPKLQHKQSQFPVQKLSFAFSGIVVIAALYFFVFNDFNATNPVMPVSSPDPAASTFRNQQPAPSQNPVTYDQQAERETTPPPSDSLNNQPEKLDQERIRLIDN